MLLSVPAYTVDTRERDLSHVIWVGSDSGHVGPMLEVWLAALLSGLALSRVCIGQGTPSRWCLLGPINKLKAEKKLMAKHPGELAPKAQAFLCLPDVKLQCPLLDIPVLLLHNAAFSSPSPSSGCEEELVGGHSKGDGQGEGRP